MTLISKQKYIIALNQQEMSKVYRGLCIARDHVDYDYFKDVCKQIGKIIEGQ